MILVLDTSTSELMVAIATEHGEVLRESRRRASANERGIHDARLASEVERLLVEANIQPSAIGRIGVVIGPGSFTGLRIGLSFAKGLGFATGASLVTLTQHEVLRSVLSDEIDAILTPGYRPGLLYYAAAGVPSVVDLIEDLNSLVGKRVVAHADLIGKIAPAMNALYAEITSAGLARLTAESSTIYSDDEIDALEPLYVTDFTPSGR